MRSRAEIRALIENALRAASLVLLAWLLWMSVDRDNGETEVFAHSGTLADMLPRSSVGGVTPARIAVRLDSTPSPEARDWLAALGGSGSVVTWSGELPALALDVHPLRSPRGGFIALAASPAGTSVQVSDGVGPLDTATTARGGAVFTIPSATGALSARTRGASASAALPEPAQLKRILVLGTAGWETKFVTAALEEDGWTVDASMHVAPGVSVTQGAAYPLDTSRYSAVIALDASAASRAAEIVRYVASGGGLVIGGSAASIDGFATLRAGTPGRVGAPEALSAGAGSITLRELPATPLVALRPDAVPLERRGESVIVAVRRHAAGRVLQQGFVDTWRWRMSGDDNSLNEHRAWWTRSVGAVAFAGYGTVTATGSPETGASAPLAGLHASLGAPVPVPAPGFASATASVSLWLLFALLALCLLGEWASRRLRGMR